MGQNLDWKKGVPRVWITEKWRNILFMLQKVITYEGWYVVTFLYHIFLLLHFEAGSELNFPFYLCQSLGRMAKCVHANPKNVNRSLYHHGLIKILIVEELNKRGDNWDAFYPWNGFVARKGPAEEIPQNLSLLLLMTMIKITVKDSAPMELRTSLF
jgi:hypothetical protein